MTERPILFSGPMVRAILEGRKTQTRRVVKPQPVDWSPIGAEMVPRRFLGPATFLASCPFGRPGDRLWVRETFMHSPATYVYEASTSTPAVPAETVYRANHQGDSAGAGWSASIHMPRWASRLTLDVKAVRVERLQDINEDDAKAEGVEAYASIGPDQRVPGPGFNRALLRDQPHRLPFADLWRSINGEDAWEQNPWVWVVEFEVLK